VLKTPSPTDGSESALGRGETFVEIHDEDDGIGFNSDAEGLVFDSNQITATEEGVVERYAMERDGGVNSTPSLEVGAQNYASLLASPRTWTTSTISTLDSSQ
jgi:hypothetical protein